MSTKPAVTLSESLWDKFDLLNYVLADDLVDEEDLLLNERRNFLESEMRQNDCLWAGLFRHKEHDCAPSMVMPPTLDVRTVTKPAASPCPANSLVPTAEDTGHRLETPLNESVQSANDVCYLSSDDEEEGSGTGSVRSSESEEGRCIDEGEVEVLLEESEFVNCGSSHITDHNYGQPPFGQADNSCIDLCTDSDGMSSLFGFEIASLGFVISKEMKILLGCKIKKWATVL